MFVATTLLIMTVAQAQPQASTTTLAGQVLDEQGQPAPGIEVLLSALEQGTRAHAVLARTKCDQAGRFQIDVPAQKDPSKARFYLALWAYVPSAGLAGQAFATSAIPAAGSVRLKLGKPAKTVVRVVGPDGKPVAGARVQPAIVRVTGGLPPSSTFPPPDALAETLAAKTDADGNGQISGCRAEDIEAVLVDAAGFGLQGSELVAARPAAPAIALKPAGRLTGRVQADDPVRRAGPGGDRHDAAAGIRSARRSSGDGPRTTDADGRFEIPALAAGKLALNVFLAERLEASTQASRRPHDRAGQDHRGHDPAGRSAARADGRGPGGRPQRPARSPAPSCSSPAIRRRGPKPQTGADGRFQLERGRRAADLPVRPKAGLPLRRPRHRARVRQT